MSVKEATECAVNGPGEDWQSSHGQEGRIGHAQSVPQSHDWQLHSRISLKLSPLGHLLVHSNHATPPPTGDVPVFITPTSMCMVAPPLTDVRLQSQWHL